MPLCHGLVASEGLQSAPVGEELVNTQTAMDNVGAADRLMCLYFEEHAVLCPACGYGLHGLAAATCPECGVGLRLKSGSDHDQTMQQRMLDWLSRHDLPCRGCGANLRGLQSEKCRTCNEVYMLKQASQTHIEVIGPARQLARITLRELILLTVGAFFPLGLSVLFLLVVTIFFSRW